MNSVQSNPLKKRKKIRSNSKTDKIKSPSKSSILNYSKRILLPFVLLFFYFLPYKNMFLVKFVEGYDFLIHFHLIYSLEQSIRNGVLLPHSLTSAVYGYGSPVFILPDVFFIFLIILAMRNSSTLHRLAEIKKRRHKP